KPVDADDVVAALLALEGRRAEPPENPMSADRVRWEHIQRIYELCGRNVSETARRLNMHRRTLQRILAKRAPKKATDRENRHDRERRCHFSPLSFACAFGRSAAMTGGPSKT